MKTNNLLAITAALALCTIGCKRDQDAPGSLATSADSLDPMAPGVGVPSDYFPTTVGKRWVYDINVPDIENNPPLVHRIGYWPSGDRGQMVEETRGRLMLRDKPKDNRVQLVLSVLAPAENQGELSYPEGYEIKIERDDLGIFGDKSSLYWAINRSTRYEVTQVTTLDPARSPANNQWGYGAKPGNSLRVYFFGAKPLTAIGISDHNETTVFIGITKYGGSDCMHFQRIVDPNRRASKQLSSDHSILDQGFTEDMWFVKGVGLARLVQMVNGHVTMTWQLQGVKGSPLDGPATLPKARDVPAKRTKIHGDEI